MKNIKFTYVILAGLLMTGTTACKKQLEEAVPQDQLVASQLSDPAALQTLYTGVYATLRGYNSTLFVLGEMRSEIWTDGLFTESLDGTYQQMYNHNISALNAPYGNWGGFYSLIYQINNAIKLFGASTSIGEAVKNQYLAEMYGLRAYVYYTMAKTWGSVPLILTPITSVNNAAETYVPRATTDSVFLQIKKDIDQSLTLFSGNNSFPSGKRVYWNRVATLVLKGDVYLWTATLRNGGNTDLTTAQSALQEVENLQGATLKLNTNYADIFDPTKKANNPEIIFAINYELAQAQMGAFSEFTVNSIQANTLTFQQSSDPTKVVSYIYPYVGGSNRCGMNQAMITKLTSGAADQRIAGTFRVMYGTTAPYPVRGIMLTKWIGSTSGTSQVYNNDFPIYRYADVLLLMAEAKAKLGQDPSAEINQIRQRAYGNSYTPYVNSSVDNNMQAILEEQLREFIGEGKRWWALRRAGDKWVFSYVDAKYLSPATVNSGKGPTLELPISLSMLNSDPLYTQTAGY
ncbi:MAG TPA: RagB/SusD family nutrient uptake outer membrane protein [Sediminibacterium sp.]|nr:RagB/SusD family nutrient uptake outer membrane protein [Sediminibacterium sp.]